MTNTNTQNDARWLVYIHTNVANDKKYIGITSRTPKERWRSGRGYQGGVFCSAIDKYGWENFTHEILFSGLTELEAKNKEIELIKFYKSNNREFGYNLTEGGDGDSGMHHTDKTRMKMSLSHTGLTHSDETKKRMSEAAKGNTRWLGKHHSNDTKSKMSKARRDYYKEHPVTAEERDKRSDRAKMAYEKDPELRSKISEKRKQYFANNPDASSNLSLQKTEYYKNHPEARKKLSEEHKKPVEMLTIDGELVNVFDSLTDAKIATGVDRSSIARVCKGKQKIAGGYKWTYHID